MKKITNISGVDCKIGRNSRTGSTLSLVISDMDIIEVVQYFNDIKAGKDPSGKIKKIELNLIYDDDIRESTQPLIEDIIIEQDEEPEEKEILPANQGDLPIYEDKEVIPKSQKL